MAISEKVLQQQIDALPKEIQPERDLWLGIEKAIGQQPNARPIANKKMPLAWAASVVAAVLLTWYSTEFSQPINEPNGAATLNVVAQMQQHFEQQKSFMLTSFGQPSLNELSPEMQDQLAQLESAQRAIEKALAEDPNNTDLINLLRWIQQQELDLIERLFSPQWQTI